MDSKLISEIISTIHLAENMKKELRHCWMSNHRQESVAEHTWRLAFFLLLVEKYLDKKLDMQKALKLALIHDLAEAVTGDLPIFANDALKETKQIAEYKAMHAICYKMPEAIGDEIFDLWEEYEARESYESKVVSALDKLEAIIQHLEAHPKTWTEWEIEYNQTGAYDKCEFDSTLAALSRAVQEKAKELIERHKDELDISV